MNADSLLARLLQHGNTRPAQTALRCGERELTYAGLQQRVADLSLALASLPPRSQVVLCSRDPLFVSSAFLALGAVVLRRQGYFRDFVFGRATSPGSYALVCPGVALNVMLHFWINKGLVASGLLVKFSPAYWSLTALAIAAQVAMIALVWRLTRQHFSAPAGLPATA